ADDVWAVGGGNTYFPLAMHWDGASWKNCYGPDGGAPLDTCPHGGSLAVLARDDIWSTESRQLCHWDGQRSDCSNIDATIVSAISPTEMWAAGTSTAGLPTTLHGVQGAWQEAPLAGPPYPT